MFPKRLSRILGITMVSLIMLALVFFLTSTPHAKADSYATLVGSYGPESSTLAINEWGDITYHTASITFEYNGGTVYVSKFSDSVGIWAMDDALDLTVVHEDGSTNSTRITSLTNDLTLSETNVTSLFEVGSNTVTVGLVDLQGNSRGLSYPLYLYEYSGSGSPPAPDLETISVPSKLEIDFRSTSGYSKDPVNNYTGDFLYNYTDISIPGRGPSPTFARSYNSGSSVEGVLGSAWIHNYEVRLTYPNASTQDVQIFSPQGRVDLYTHNQDGTYSPPLNVQNSLEKIGSSYLVTNRDQTVWTFDESGKLQRITDKYGNQSVLSYNQNGQLISVSDPAARGNIVFAYNGSGFLISVTDWAGRIVSFTYDGNNRLSTVTDREANTTTYGYDGISSRLTTITDANGHVVVTNTYDGDGRVATQKDALGLTTGQYTNFEYQDNIDGTRTTTVTYPITSNDPNWNHVEIDIHDEDGQLLQRVFKPSADPSEWYTQSHTYDTNGFPTSFTDGLGNTTLFCYDVAYDGSPISGSYGNTTRVISPPPSSGADQPVTLFKYDSSNNLIETVTPNGVDSGASVTCSTDLSGSVNENYAISYRYNGSQTLLLSTTMKFTDPDQGTQTAVTKYEYNDSQNPGLMTTMIPPLGNTGASPDYDYAVAYRYGTAGSTAGMLLEVSAPLTSTTTYDYDSVGRMTAMVNANGNVPGATASDYTREYTYDDENRVLVQTVPAPTSGGSAIVTQFVYDNVGNQTAVIDPNGQVIKYDYDVRDQLAAVSQSPSAWTDLASPPIDVITTNYTYDHFGNLLVVTRAAGDSTYERTTAYLYDGLNRIRTEVVYPNWPSTTALITTYTYDANGNRLTLTDPLLQTTTYEYDNLNRLILKDFDTPTTSVDVAYTYDANGNRLNMDNTIADVSYTYDEANRLVEVETLTLPNAHTVGYRYDLGGNRIQVIYPDNTVVTYVFDEANRLTSVLDWNNRETTYEYNVDGTIARLDNHNGTHTLYDYDNAGRMIDIHNKDGNTTLSQHVYTLDNAGNRTMATEEIDEDDYVLSYTYDGMYRLIEEDQNLPGSSNDVVVSYDYDPLGNRLQKIIDPYFGSNEVIDFTYDRADRIDEASGDYNEVYTVDANGNLTYRSTSVFDKNHYWFNQENRMIGSKHDNFLTYYYLTDGDGNRMSIVRTFSTSTSFVNWYVYDTNQGLPVVLQDRDYKYVWGLGLLYSEEQTFGREYVYHYDGVGSVRLMTDDDADIRLQQSYDAFGLDLVNPTFSTEQPFGFAGEQTDGTEFQMPDSGYSYMRARYYDPVIGRFVSRDPLRGTMSDPLTLNPYTYVENNPINKVDPSGLSSNKALSGLSFGDLTSEQISHLLQFGYILPEHTPPGVDINANMQEARRHSGNILWFIEMVKTGGDWDYKKYGSEYEEYGNFHYAVVGRAFGLPSYLLRAGAGGYQVITNNQREKDGLEPVPSHGTLLIQYPYGDDYSDQRWINQGIIYYDSLTK